METFLILKILLAIFCGYIYAEHLTRPNMILNGWFVLLDRTFSTNHPFWFDYALNRHRFFIDPKNIFKPLVGCFRCVCGQWGMWTYFIQAIAFHNTHFNIFYMFASGCVGVGFSIVLHLILGKDE